MDGPANVFTMKRSRRRLEMRTCNACNLCKRCVLPPFDYIEALSKAPLQLRLSRNCGMGMRCEICDKKPVRGNQVAQRGKAKYLGGNGRKTTGISRRAFRPNLQRIQVQEGERSVTRRICTQCLRSGKVVKAIVRKPFTLPSK